MAILLGQGPKELVDIGNRTAQVAVSLAASLFGKSIL